MNWPANLGLPARSGLARRGKGPWLFAWSSAREVLNALATNQARVTPGVAWTASRICSTRSVGRLTVSRTLREGSAKPGGASLVSIPKLRRIVVDSWSEAALCRDMIPLPVVGSSCRLGRRPASTAGRPPALDGHAALDGGSPRGRVAPDGHDPEVIPPVTGPTDASIAMRDPAWKPLDRLAQGAAFFLLVETATPVPLATLK